MNIRGDIDEIRFRNEENGFTILVLDIDGEPVISAGVFPPVVEGQTVTLTGEYVVHPDGLRRCAASASKRQRK